ncbi:hypothetical protein [Roseovarius autotrophicus]|nr:hypothetical protein [Roseovarius autotrophicus]
MKLAYTMAPGRGDTDLVLERLAADLAALMAWVECVTTKVDEVPLLRG